MISSLPTFSLISCPALSVYSDGDCSRDGLYGIRNYFVLSLARPQASIAVSGPLVLYLGLWGIVGILGASGASAGSRGAKLVAIPLSIQKFTHF